MQRCVVFCLAVFVVLAFAVPGRAQIHPPPKPGVPMPEAYFERIKQDPTAFQFRRAWKREARRVKEQRRALALSGKLSGLAGDQAPSVIGTKRVPVLAARYSNRTAPYNVTDLQKQLFDGPNATGTVTEYYNQISAGKIDLQGDVYGSGSQLYRLSRADTYYEGTQNGLGGDAKTGQLIKELLDGLDSGIDFTQYDNDGPDGLPNSGDDDGFVDFVAFVHPEFGGECGGSNMWSHRWVYEGWYPEAYETDDAAAGGGFIKVSDYTIQPLLSCDRSSIIEIGVYAHEFGHAFDLPDLYDTNSGDGESSGIGVWGLMASGSWGGNNSTPERPTHMCAWSKEQLGWVNPTTLCTATALDLAPVWDSGDVVRIYPHGQQSEEYFLLEYRAQAGFDATLPVEGLAVWHIDNRNFGNGDEDNKQVDLEEADGKFDLDNGTNRGDSGDLFPGGTINRNFDNGTSPNSKANKTGSTGIALSNIHFGGSGMTLNAELTDCRLRLLGLGVDDSEWGNNANNLDAQEQVEVEVCVTNDFDFPRNEVSIRLESNSEKVKVLSGEMDLGDVGAQSPICATFWIESSAGIINGEELEFTVTLDGQDGYQSIHKASLFAGDYVLVVEDNGIVAYGGFYSAAVENAGYGAVVYNADQLGTPSSSTLKGAMAAVWYTSAESFTTLRKEEQNVLTDYLGSGGSLFLSGDDIGFDLSGDGSSSDRAFYENWLRARYLHDNIDLVEDPGADRSLSGVAGDPIGDGLSYNLNGIRSKWPSVIEPINGAHPVMEYGPGLVGAIRYEGDYNLLYTAFNFEGGGTLERNALMERFLDRYINPDRQAPQIQLTGGINSVYDVCDPVLVTWEASDESGVAEVEIFLYRNEVQVASLVTLQGDPGTYTWNPDTIGEGLRLKVVARDSSGLQAHGLTGLFTLTDTDAPTVTVIYPNGGEVLALGEAVEITWDQSDCSGIVSARVSISEDYGKTWSEIGETQGENSLPWTAPLEAKSVLVQVEVEDHDGKLSEDSSDGPAYVGLSAPFRGATRAVLLQNSPNPFEPAFFGPTVSQYFLPQEASVKLSIYDIRGRLVRELFKGTQGEGQHEVSWDGVRDNGSPASPGIYFMVLNSTAGNQVRKLVKL